MSSGVADGPMYIPRYLPLVWEKSTPSQEMEESISRSGVVMREYGIS